MVQLVEMQAHGCRAACTPIVVHVTQLSHVPSTSASKSNNSTWKAQLPLSWEGECTISETTCPWLTTHTSREPQHVCTETTGNAEGILEGRCLFLHLTFEHLVWLYCRFAAPSDSVLGITYVSKYLKYHRILDVKHRSGNYHSDMHKQNNTILPFENMPCRQCLCSVYKMFFCSQWLPSSAKTLPVSTSMVQACSCSLHQAQQLLQALQTLSSYRCVTVPGCEEKQSNLQETKYFITAYPGCD